MATSFFSTVLKTDVIIYLFSVLYLKCIVTKCQHHFIGFQYAVLKIILMKCHHILCFFNSVLLRPLIKCQHLFSVPGNV